MRRRPAERACRVAEEACAAAPTAVDGKGARNGKHASAQPSATIDIHPTHRIFPLDFPGDVSILDSLSCTNIQLGGTEVEDVVDVDAMSMEPAALSTTALAEATAAVQSASQQQEAIMEEL